jgi:hypothetical protein
MSEMRPYAHREVRGRTRRGAVLDPMIRGPKRMAAEPRQVVVELEPSDYVALETFCRSKCCTVLELVRVVALRLARSL